MKAAVDFEAELANLERILGHRFARIDHLATALTHRSFANERKHGDKADNERLEFLGDALLGMIVASMLVEAFPQATEGELTRRRADLVREESLAQLARSLELGRLLRLGKGEERTGGRERPRLLASALEACFGAVLVDAGIETAAAVVRTHFGPRLSLPGIGDRDFKSRVQEWAQARGMAVPRYAVVGGEGPEHERRFDVALNLGDRVVATGSGRNKLEAEQRAAEAALLVLEAESAVAT